MSMVGGNIAEMQQLEQQFQREGQAVGELKARITGVLNATTWTGPAADRFKQEWHDQYARALDALQRALEENAGVVRNRRAALEQAMG